MHTKETEEETSKTITPSDVVSSDLSSRSDSCASNNEQSNIENTNENIETHKENAINTTSVSIVETESPSVEKQTEAEKTQDESVVESNENLKAETCQRINTETLSAPSEVAAKDTDSKLQVSPESTATDENVAASVVCVTHEGMDATSDDNLTVTENLINEIECVTQDDTNLAQEFILMPGNDQELQLSNLQLVLLTDVEGQNLHGSLTIPEEEIMQSDEITENSVLQTYDESGTVHMSCNTDIVANAFNMADMGIDVRDIRAYERLNGDLVNSNVSEMASSNSLSKSQDSDAVLQDKKKHLHAKRSKNKSSHSPNGSVVSPVRTSGSDNSSGKINATSWMSDQTLTMPATSTPVRATSADDEHDLSGFSNGFPYYVGKEGQSCPAVQPSVPKAHFATKRLDGILKSSHKTDSKSVGNSVQEKSGTVVKSRTKRARLSDNTNEYVIPARTQTEKIKPMIYRSSLEVYGISEKDKNLRNKPNIYLTSALPDDMLQSYLVRIDKQKKYDAQNKSHKRERTKQKHHGYQEQQTTSVDDGVEPSEKRRRMELERMQEDVKRQLQDKRHESRIQKVIYKNSPNAVYPETSSRLQFKSQTGTVDLHYYDNNNVVFEDVDVNFQSDCDDNCSIYSDQIQNPPVQISEKLPVLNLTVPIKETQLAQIECEFSNSPKFLHDSDSIVRHCLVENSENSTTENLNVNIPTPFLSNNSNFYNIPNKLSTLDVLCNSNSSNIQSCPVVENSHVSFTKTDNQYVNCLQENIAPIPTAVPHVFNDIVVNSYNDEKSRDSTNDSPTQENDGSETRLPFKKRRMSVANVKRELLKEEISYPATPMMSIAEIEALQNCKLEERQRPFKTPAERKEMPPLPPVFYNLNSEPSPIITDQFNINNHTYNNPTINYHMGNVPVPFINIPCTPYYSVPPILVPFNNMQSFNSQRSSLQEKTAGSELKKEKKNQENKR